MPSLARLTGRTIFCAICAACRRTTHVGTQAQLRIYHEWNYHPETPGGRLGHVKSIAELAEAVFPDLTHPKRYAGLARQVEQWHARGLAVAGSPPHLGGELFETAWRIRGFEEFLIDLKERKSLANYLLDQLTAMLIHNALILAQAGVDILLLDDDVAMPTGLMISPALWREMFGGRLANVIQLTARLRPSCWSSITATATSRDQFPISLRSA